MELRDQTYTVDDLNCGNLHNRDLRELDYLIEKYGEDDPHVKDFNESHMIYQSSTPDSTFDLLMLDF